uniref:Ubiquinol-cytochrome c reductase core protein 2a n=1 Tax=Nothobranchius furzeri TaxID=105023 RepID=A0A8C6PXN9_NOTFU
MKGVRSLYNFSKRSYAAARRGQTLSEPLSSLKPARTAPFPPQNVQVSKLPNGLVIASLENYSPLSSIGVFVKAGSRFETSENLGVSHVLRLAANLTTKGASAFKICHSVEALGGSLSVTGSRETMVYTADCLRDDIEPLLEFLVNVTTAQEFRPWEVNELTPRVKIDKALVQQCPQMNVMEMLHEAAYKNALSNSLYCPDFMVGRISSEQLHSFVEDNFTSGRMALVGLGVNHSILKQVGEGLLGARSGARAPVTKAVYRGGELRLKNSDDLVHALIVSEGSVTGSAEANAFTVLQRILGAGPYVKRGSGPSSKLSQGIAKATTQPFDVSRRTKSLCFCLRATQTDTRLEINIPAVSPTFCFHRNQVKAECLMSMETSECLLGEIGAQVLTTAAYQAPESVLQAIDAVTKDDVMKAAKKFVDGKKTMAASGHLVNTPFVDEL